MVCHHNHTNASVALKLRFEPSPGIHMPCRRIPPLDPPVVRQCPNPSVVRHPHGRSSARRAWIVEEVEVRPESAAQEQDVADPRRRVLEESDISRALRGRLKLVEALLVGGSVELVIACHVDDGHRTEMPCDPRDSFRFGMEISRHDDHICIHCRRFPVRKLQVDVAEHSDSHDEMKPDARVSNRGGLVKRRMPQPLVNRRRG